MLFTRILRLLHVSANPVQWLVFHIASVILLVVEYYHFGIHDEVVRIVHRMCRAAKTLFVPCLCKLVAIMIAWACHRYMKARKERMLRLQHAIYIFKRFSIAVEALKLKYDIRLVNDVSAQGQQQQLSEKEVKKTVNATISTDTLQKSEKLQVMSNLEWQSQLAKYERYAAFHEEALPHIQLFRNCIQDLLDMPKLDVNVAIRSEVLFGEGGTTDKNIFKNKNWNQVEVFLRDMINGYGKK